MEIMATINLRFNLNDSNPRLDEASAEQLDQLREQLHGLTDLVDANSSEELLEENAENWSNGIDLAAEAMASVVLQDNESGYSTTRQQSSAAV